MTAPGRAGFRLTDAVRRRRDKPRRYLRPGLTLDDLFGELDRLGVRYAVLRWFDGLPSVEPGEDIDLLVADEDVPRLRPFLASYYVPLGTQKFDVYTVSGLPGTDFLTVPYFTPALASRVLERAVLLRGRYRVPSDEDHFDSLAYHAVYHKGERSGLPADAAAEPPAAAGEHDYAAVLAALAERLSLPVSLTLDGLDTYLADKGLRPPLDTLDKLGAGNAWLRERIEKLWGPSDAGMPGLAVFVLRERARHLLDRLQVELLREGFQPLETIELTGEVAERVATEVRGGNWGQGPWPVAGGGPAAYVVAYDLTRSVAEAAGPDGPRVTDAKLAIRERLLGTLGPGEQRYNPLHSSDDPRQALDYLAPLEDPGVVTRLQRRIADIRAGMVFPYPVVEVLPSLQRRAVIAVVRHPEHGECVCKLFYPSSLRFLERELRARTEFADLPESPALLEAGPNYLLTPRYTDTRRHVRRTLAGMRHVQLAPWASLAMARLARDLHERGAYLLDLSTQNLVTDPDAGLKVLDWEFLQDHRGDAPALAGSPTVTGRVPDRAADSPVGGSTGVGRGTLFRPLFTGVPRAVLLAAPGPLLAPLAETGMVAFAVLRAARRAVLRVASASRRRAKLAVKAALVATLGRAGAAP
ncbi:hypothetical protein OF117_17345 [Geodermatophilus sp. YIM 151500]|uniref:hypothetical protein n=1 Tax=Geodermatophilus sp. YIM 151500 TaxID=2984531 RepID=UPI0021E4E129|nr:hypothetical protein [Geodermatophilus sp. YIM 151500]MCV2491117.1 hypothetical protein [Geodermatophilus sp. YIM 151500]